MQKPGNDLEEAHPREVILHLVPERTAPARARHAAESTLEKELEPETLEIVRLLISELVTNSLRHAGLGEGSTIGLQVFLYPERVRVEVTDPGPGFEIGVGPPIDLAQGGIGLQLVDKLSDRWGVVAGPATVVWFEIDR